MSQIPRLVIRGAHSSPYSRKMRAVLRYRHIPHDWVVRGAAHDDMPEAAVPVIPVIGWRTDDGSFRDVMVDSSPQITKLEGEYAGRSLVAPDAATAFLDFVLEDFADEWIAKMMYHYRWANDVDAQKSGRILPLDADLQLPDDKAAQAHRFFVDRQVGRRALIGSTDANAPLIEASYERTLDALQQHLGEHDFFFGARPGRADFAFFGQLMPMLWWDPTPTAIAVERAPRSVMWNQWMDDLSWWRVDGDEGWVTADDTPATTRALFAEMGRTYVPFLLANAAAIESGAEEVVCEIDGAEFRQAPFKYQAKCLAWIREAHAALDDADRRRAEQVLIETGCEELVR
ncbi:MAG: glutathione S-transferase C-terminal domain-containing protein [Actinomycetota bacterium]